jgi:hypothetical protein
MADKGLKTHIWKAIIGHGSRPEVPAEGQPEGWLPGKVHLQWSDDR